MEKSSQPSSPAPASQINTPIEEEPPRSKESVFAYLSAHPQRTDQLKPPIPAPGIEADFALLQESVLVKRPVLRDILRQHGRDSLLSYANDYIDVNLNPPILRRQSELLSTINEAVYERYGKRVADSVVTQLEKYYFVSTADHIGPIVHPFFVNSNLLTALALQTHSDPVLQNIVVLGCANVSVDNSSFPRGLFFNTERGETLVSHRLPFFSSNTRPPTVYALQPYTSKETDKILHTLKVKQEKEEITRAQQETIEELLREIYCSKEMYECSSYPEQVGKTNFQLWKRFFRQSGVELPNLVYLEAEEIVVRLLTKYHLTQDTVINHILFDPAYEPYINQYYDGIFGSFSRADASGTYLFWALPKGSRYNLQLWRQGNFLVSKDGSYRIELHPEVIRDAMQRKELIPGLLLNFITISFYYGLKCLGGFNQVNYLTLMKNAFIKMNVDLGNYRSIEVCARAQTKEICDGLTLAFLGYDGGRVALASGLDLILYGDEQSWNKLQYLSKQMTFEEALNPLMPEIYRISYEPTNQDPRLLAVTEKDINHMSGLDRKVIPCARIPKGK